LKAGVLFSDYHHHQSLLSSKSFIPIKLTFITFQRQSIVTHPRYEASLSFAKFCKSLTPTLNVADKFINEQID